MYAQTYTILIDDSRSRGGRTYLFEAPSAIIEAHRAEEVAPALAAIEAARAGGAYVAGYFTYELGYVLEPKLQPLLPDTDGPLLWFGVFPERRLLDADELAAFLRQGLDPSYELTNVTFSMGQEAYEDRFRQVKSYIAAGDIYQLNLTLKGWFRFAGSRRALYRDLRLKQPVAYGALIETPGHTILSASPELFLEFDGSRVLTRPMKGTADRGSTLASDDEIRRWLRSDEKSRAENLMIVDLMRNDVGRVARMGSVRVTDLFSVETYETLHQMTSGVTAELRDEVDIGTLVESVFPPGSITGAPKMRAMEIIRELETGPRGVYTGAIGAFAPDGTACFNVAIRTVTIGGDGHGEIGIGSGVVQDSAVDAEYEECLLKMKFLTEDVRDFSLFETMLFEPGAGYALLERHLARMGRSAAYFRYPFDETAASDLLAKEAEGFGNCDQRVRLVLARDGTLTVTSTPLPPGSTPASMRYVVSEFPVRSGNRFLYHKTTERELYDGEHARMAERFGTDEVIFLNERGELAEGSRTNIFIEKGGVLFTPALSSGLLPGTLREELIANGRAREAVLTLADLETADQVYLGNSVRGLLPATPIEAPQPEAIGAA